MKKIIHAILASCLLAVSQGALAQTLSQQAAIALAETFVVENGYTITTSRIKNHLDLESIERTSDRSEMLRRRHSTLQPTAIGAKQGRRGAKLGWSIAFEYTSSTRGAENGCRVVTMDGDGSNIRIEHQDGIREFFAGFE